MYTLTPKFVRCSLGFGFLALVLIVTLHLPVLLTALASQALAIMWGRE
jgi:hypothetical protein